MSIFHAAVGSSFAELALRPVRLDGDGLLGILEGLLVLGLGAVDGGTVGVEDVVLGFDSDGLGEFLTGVSSATSR